MTYINRWEPCDVIRYVVITGKWDCANIFCIQYLNSIKESDALEYQCDNSVLLDLAIISCTACNYAYGRRNMCIVCRQMYTPRNRLRHTKIPCYYFEATFIEKHGLFTFRFIYDVFHALLVI